MGNCVFQDLAILTSSEANIGNKDNFEVRFLKFLNDSCMNNSHPQEASRGLFSKNLTSSP